jgi:hypothetical protein
MFQDRTLAYFLKNYPDHSNVDPWNEGKTLKCASLVEKYQQCMTTTRERSAVHMLAHCRELKNIAVKCFALEPKYFKEAVDAVQLEESYFSDYLAKELQQIRIREPEKAVWRTKAS